uniref:Extensin-like isoform X4 n=1 Tax=Saccoglossus kowalevskii TaxID=10224 RepID=A0ABM0MGZ7_SACKO|nr:PREDICTED: extensin-like isoform X4 [Saccoglossus kowalevskii]
MPIWYYEKSELHKTPTIQDGLDFSVEARYRKEGARFIIDAGTSLGLRYDTLATGVVYFHRFYMFHSFKTFPRYVTGAACLFLAGKVEETPKKCKDIVRAAKTLLPEHYFTTFGDDPKEEIMTFERILLQTIKFDLQVDHPYTYLLKYARVIKGDKAKIQQLVQMGWTFINDSLCTTLCLQWEPQVLAVAVMYLAGRLSKSDVLDWQCKGSRTKWWDPFIEDVTLEMLEDICHQVLDLYTGQDPTKSEGISMSAKHKMGRPKTPPEPAPGKVAQYTSMNLR